MKTIGEIVILVILSTIVSVPAILFILKQNDTPDADFEKYIRTARKAAGSNCIFVGVPEDLKGWYCIKFVGSEKPQSEFMGRYLKGK